MNLSGFDKKTQLQSCSPQKSMRFKKKVSKLLFSFKSYEHLYFRARPVTNRVKFGGFDKKTQLQSCSPRKSMPFKKK